MYRAWWRRDPAYIAPVYDGPNIWQKFKMHYSDTTTYVVMAADIAILLIILPRFGMLPALLTMIAVWAIARIATD